MRVHTKIERSILFDIFREFPTKYLVTKDGAFLPRKSGNDIDLLVEDFELASKYVYMVLLNRNEVFEVVAKTNMSRFLIKTDSTEPLEIDIFYQLAKKWIPILDFQSAQTNVYTNSSGINCLTNDSSKALSVVKDYCTYGKVRSKNIELSGKLILKEDFQIIHRAILKFKVYCYYKNNIEHGLRMFGFVRFSYLINPIYILKYVNRYFRTRRMWKDHNPRKGTGFFL